jgi:hypothetical protein
VYLISTYETEWARRQREDLTRDDWRLFGAFGLFSEVADICRIVHRHATDRANGAFPDALFASEEGDYPGSILVKELGDVLWFATFLAFHHGTNLTTILGVEAFRDYDCPRIFTGADGVIMAAGSLAVDMGKITNALLFHDAVYSRPRGFQQTLGGIVWCIGSIAKSVGSDLEAVALRNTAHCLAHRRYE